MSTDRYYIRTTGQTGPSTNASGTSVTPTGNIAATNVQAALAELDSEKIAKTTAQSAETTAVRLAQVNPKTSSGAAPFEILFNSFANSGAGAGTYNHAAHIGINASRHGDTSNATANAPTVYMGFEDNYYDPDADLSYGAEWYTGYVTPDGSTLPVATLRPFYWRVWPSNTNTTDKNVQINFDLGAGTGGKIDIWNGVLTGDEILGITTTQIVSYVPFNTPSGVGMQCGGDFTLLGAFSYSGTPTFGSLSLNNTLTVNTSSDRLKLGIISTSLPSSSAGAYIGWLTSVSGTSAGDLAIIPRTSNASKTRIYGSTSTTPYEGIQVGASGSAATLGFYGTSAVAKPTVSGAKGSNAALGSLLTALASLGLITDSSSA